ncbi:aspartate/methionine/tyrosine aminotransferase [Paraburkholderia sp. 32]
MVMAALIEDGQSLLSTEPGYPSYKVYAKLAGGELKSKRLTTTVVDGGENRHQSGAHHFRFDGHHCDRVGSQAG